MTAKELNLSSYVYKVSREKIIGQKVTSIACENRCDGEVYVIDKDYECEAKDKLAHHRNYSNIVLFIDLEEAKIHQAILREKYIKELYEASQKAFEDYNKIVQHYLYMPISNPIYV